MSVPTRAFIGLGANLGNARTAVERALDALAQIPGTRVLARSSLYVSAPHDAAGPDYFNAVAELATSQTASDLLAQPPDKGMSTKSDRSAVPAKKRFMGRMIGSRIENCWFKDVQADM